MQIEARAKIRLADEYDAAQARGEVKTRADNQHVPDGNKHSSADLGLSRKQIHEARQIRNAESDDPGNVPDQNGRMTAKSPLFRVVHFALATAARRKRT